MIEQLHFHNGFASPAVGDFYFGDVLTLLPKLTMLYASQVKLIYLDPPFMTGREFDASMPVGERGFAGERAYYAKIPLYSDTWDKKEDYLAFLRKVIEGAKELLTDDGVICLHVDRHAAAHVRLLLDDVFGEDAFINEIIWHYHSGGSSKTSFPAKHDNLFLYGKHPGVKINPAAAGKSRADVKHNHMKKNTDENGRVYYSINSAGKEYRYYEDEVVSFDDVWDIPHLQQKHPERTGFGTQKPLELLDRLVASCSGPGDLVADLFAGSGTTLISAGNLGRRFLGVDKAPLSLLSFRRRVAELRATEVMIHHEQTVDNPSGVTIHKEESTDRLTVSVDGYRVIDTERCLPEYADGLQYLTYLAIGRMEDDHFITEEFSVRTRKKTSLKTTMTTEPGKDKRLLLCDCLGNQRWIEL